MPLSERQVQRQFCSVVCADSSGGVHEYDLDHQSREHAYGSNG
jgi:hypothetical protein